MFKFAVIIAVVLFSQALSAHTAMTTATEAYLPLSEISQGVEWTQPPHRLSRQQIEAWVSQYTKQIAMQMGVSAAPRFELYTQGRWASYVNFEHFVPLSAEDVPEGFGMNYHWSPGVDRALPAGEITETGKFIYWANSCDFYELTERQCEHSIMYLVAHEIHHFTQWRRMAQEAKAALGEPMTAAPVSRGDLSKAAYDLLLTKWNDEAHYQCREVEVYTQDVKRGKMPAKAFAESAGIRNYVEKCRASKWTKEFAEFIRQADEYIRSAR